MVRTNAAATAVNDRQRQSRDELYGLVGKALSQWSDLELKLHLIAIRCWTGNDLYHTSEILDSVIAFEAKMKLIGTILRQHSPSEEAVRVWPYFTAYLSKLKRKRDRIAHSIVTRKKLSETFVLLPFISFANLDEDAFNGSFSPDDLRSLIDKFEEATFVAMEFSWLAQGQQEIPLEGIHEQAQRRFRDLRAKAAQAPTDIPPPSPSSME